MRSTCKSVSLPATSPNWWDEMNKTEKETGREAKQGRQNQTLEAERSTDEKRHKKKKEKD